jgi:hypothetical protein
MKQAAAIVSLILLLLAGHSTVAAQESAGSPVATDENAIVMVIEVDTSVASTFGFTRTTIAPGGSFRFAAGTGPAVRFVEQGSLHLSVQSDALSIVKTSSATPETSPAGDHLVESGAAFIVAPGGSIELRNDGPDSATILELLSASDATLTNEADVSHLVLAQRNYTLSEGAVTISLSSQSLQPGDQFDWPSDPAVTTLYPLERSDAFLLTAQGFNRGTHPITFYAVTIAPVTG